MHDGIQCVCMRGPSADMHAVATCQHSRADELIVLDGTIPVGIELLDNLIKDLCAHAQKPAMQQEVRHVLPEHGWPLAASPEVCKHVAGATLDAWVGVTTHA
jgi:hypothetical protein